MRIVSSSPSSEVGAFSRRQVLVLKGDKRAALALVKILQGKPGGLRCFGAARQVPQRLYSLDELKLSGIETASLLSPVDAALGAVERNLRLAAVAGGVSVSFNGGVSSLVLDTIGHTFSANVTIGLSSIKLAISRLPTCWGFFPGGSPVGYTISSLEALQKEGSLNVQAGTSSVDFEFLEEVNSGEVRAAVHFCSQNCKMIYVGGPFLTNRGLRNMSLLDAQQILVYSAGGCWHGISATRLDVMLRSLGFTQKKADSQVRWSVLNTEPILQRHKGARAKLAEAMPRGKSVGACVDIIENAIDEADIISKDSSYDNSSFASGPSGPLMHLCECQTDAI